MMVKFKEKKNIQNKIALIITFVGLLALVSGTSYAILKGSISSDNEHVITAGSATLKLTEKFDNIDKKIMIMSDSNGLLQEDVYEFNIKNVGDVTARYDLKLVNEVSSDYTGEVLPIEYIKVGLEINEEEYGPMSLGELNGIIDSGIIYKKEVINYKLRIWLDKDKQSELEELSDYKAFLKLKVETEQRPDSFDDGKATVFNYTGEEEKYIVPRDGWYYIEMAGAQGGSSYKENDETYRGGKGSVTSGYVELKAGEMLYFRVGGKGSRCACNSSQTCCGSNGGYNGGGSSFQYTGSGTYYGSGGGATDVRFVENKETQTKFRYIRDYLNGSSANVNGHWVEIKVYDTAGSVISKGKTVTYEGTGAHYGGSASSVSILTDGDIASSNYFGLESKNAYVEVDLGQEYEISKVEIWHYYGDGRIYYNNKTMLLNNDKTKSVTIFDSDKSGTYAETSSGRTSQNTALINSLLNRIMVAAGGGGASNWQADSTSGYNFIGGHGGYLYGEKGDYTRTDRENSCVTATQTNGGTGDYSSGGNFGLGATADKEYGPGAGGGYYGGGATETYSTGGSSYISGYAGVNSVTNNTTITHTNQTLHFSGKYFIGGKILSGENEGNGYAKIQYVDIKPKRKNTKLNNIRYIKDCTSYNSANNYNFWVELQAIKDGINIAKGKTISGTTSEYNTTTQTYKNVVDGTIYATGGSGFGTPLTPALNQCVTVDLGANYDLDEVAVWNYFNDGRTFYDAITYVSSDNSNWTKVIDEAGLQNSNGRRVNSYGDTLNGYIQDNLILWYDGGQNSGYSGNTRTSSGWKDLSGNGNNGTLNGGTWQYNNLLTSSYVSTSIYLPTALPSTSDRTLSITLRVNSLPFTNTTYGNTGVFIGAGYYSGMAIYWTRPTSANSFYSEAVTRANGGQVWPSYGTFAYPTKILNLVYVYNPTEGKATSYLNGVKVAEGPSASGDYAYPSDIGNLGINKAQIMGGNAPSNYANINVYSAKVYYDALTDEEVLHNYLIDKERFDLE